MLDLNYSATVKDINVEGINKFLKAGAGIDIEVGKPEAFVKYLLEPDAREYGIKSITITIEQVTAEINWYVHTDDLTPEEKQSLIAAGGTEMRNDTIEGTITIDSRQKLNGKEWELISEMKFSKDGSLWIDSVTINLPEQKITVSTDNNND